MFSISPGDKNILLILTWRCGTKSLTLVKCAQLWFCYLLIPEKNELALMHCEKKKNHLLGEQTTVSHWYGHWKYFPFKEPVEQKVILTKSWCVIVSHVVQYSTTLDARILYIGWGALLKNSEKVELYNLITQHTENMVRSFQTFQYLIISWK